ncbi:MAG TPA: DUF202 domain-containing protein [Flavobacterium sp.]|nr:DUF202 domain-containing protein [Flavobacterium sp.]
MNKDLILREKLAIERTHMANQTTLLAFFRTSMYFFVAGLSINELLDFDKNHLVAMVMYLFSVLLFVYGIAHFIVQRKWIDHQKRHIGDYKTDYEKTV